VEEKTRLFGRWSGTRKRKFSVHPVGQEKKYCGGIGAEKWNGQCLGSRREGLESLIQ